MLDEKKVLELLQNVRAQCAGYLGRLCIVVNPDDPPRRGIKVGEQFLEFPEKPIQFHAVINVLDEILTVIIEESKVPEIPEKPLVPRSPIFTDKPK